MRWQAGRKNGLYLPARGAIQRSSGGDPVPRTLEIELGYRDIKSAMQHNAITLEKQKVDSSGAVGIAAWIHPVRREASQAAVAHQRAPNEVSLWVCLSVIANQMAVMAARYRFQPIRHGGWREFAGCIGALVQKTPQAIETQAVKISKDPFSG